MTELITRESVEREITELATKARRGGRMHRDYLEWHGRINILLDTWRQLVFPPVAPACDPASTLAPSFSDAEGNPDDVATPTA